MAGPQPTLLTMHGGPHTQMVQFYAPSLAYYISMGVAVVNVNYRGSTGYGTDFTMALPGYISTVDVEDCIQAVRLAVDKGNSVYLHAKSITLV